MFIKVGKRVGNRVLMSIGNRVLMSIGNRHQPQRNAYYSTPSELCLLISRLLPQVSPVAINIQSLRDWFSLMADLNIDVDW